MRQLRTFQLISKGIISGTVVQEVYYATSFAKAKEFFSGHFFGKYIIRDDTGKELRVNFKDPYFNTNSI